MLNIMNFSFLLLYISDFFHILREKSECILFFVDFVKLK